MLRPECARVLAQPPIERGAVRMESHGFEAKRRSSYDWWRSCPPFLFPDLIDDDLLADLIVGIRSGVEADQAYPGVAQQHTRG